MIAPLTPRDVGRFGGSMAAWTIAATLAWWYAHDWLARACLATAKELHEVVGAPAPYLLAEAMDLWWIAPPAQLLIGLVLASWWRPSWGRLVDLVFCLTLYWFIAVMTVVLACSPYIGLARFRDFTAILMTKGLLIMTPIVLWGLVVLPALFDVAAAGGRSEFTASFRPKERRRFALRLRPMRYLLTLGICLLLPAACWGMARAAPAEIRDARAQMARLLRAGVDRASVGAAIHLGQLEVEHRGHDLTLYYLTAKMLQELGDTDAAIHVLNPVRFQTPFDALRVELRSQAATLRHKQARG